MAKAKTFGEWREVLHSYSRQTPEQRAQIQKELPEFARRFAELAMETAEYKKDVETSETIRAEIDRLLIAMEEGSKQVDELKAELNVITSKIKELGEITSLVIAEKVAGVYIHVLRQGLNDRDPLVQKAAQDTLRSLTTAHYSPRLGIYRWLCGNTSDFGEFLKRINIPISDLVLEQTKKRPLLFIDSIRARSEGFEPMLLAMAEAKNPLVRKTILDLVRSKRDEDVALGLHCLINWPMPEALPSLINQIQTSERNETALETALVCYGESGLRAMLRAWPALTEGARYIVFEAVCDLPSQAALDLVLQGVWDRRSEVRVEAAEALGSLRSSEWHESFAGRDPKNLDRRRVSQLLQELVKDPDEAVRDAARRALGQG